MFVYLHGDDTDEMVVNSNTPRLPSLDEVSLPETVPAGGLFPTF